MELRKGSKLSVEELARLQQLGFVHAGFDWDREREIFHSALSGKATLDPQMLPREYYNDSKYDLVVKLIPPFRYAPDSHPSKFEFELRSFPKETFCFCPHGYYRVEHLDGTPFTESLHTNLGKKMGTGNKLLSRPEVKTRVFQKR